MISITDAMSYLICKQSYLISESGYNIITTHILVSILILILMQCLCMFRGMLFYGSQDWHTRSLVTINVLSVQSLISYVVKS